MPPVQMRLNNEELRERMRDREFLSGQEVNSIDAENRTVDILFFSGIDIPRTDWWTGQKYVLRFDPKGADFSLLNNGAPVLDNHSAWGGSAAQKGKVEKAWQEGSNSKATLRFSKRPSVDELWGDIQDKIVTKFSMGVEILREEKIQENNQEVRLAKKWRPFELSVAPIPADFNTNTLAAEERGSSVPQRASAQKGTKMEETQGVKSPDAPLDTEALKREAAVAERNRILEIHKITLSAKLDVALEDQHTKAGTSIDEFRKIALNALAERSEADAKSTPTQTHHVDLVRDEQDMRHELMSSALTGRMNPGEFKDDRNNQFIGMTLMRFAEESVRLQHHMNRIPRRDEVIKLAMQTTSDFANVLENVARKQLLAQYNLVQPTYKLWTKPSTTPDFKTMTRNRLSEAPTFLKVPEGGQITIGSMTDSKESYAISTYGRGVSFTRQMLINDDLGAFNDIIGMFGAQAARLENKTVYAILNANANMADSAALFVAGHGNLGAGVIANTALDAMFTAMGIQKGVDGVSVLNLTPKFLIVPKAKEATARAALVATGPNVKASDANWFAGRLEPVADAELDGTSTAVWYGACDPAIAPGIEYAHLEGANGPQFIREDNDQGILGVQFYAFLDFGAKAVDWRPLYKSSGS